jgi:hypothetical protein
VGRGVCQKVFGDLNHNILGLPSDGKIIILSDSDEEEEVREEKAADAEATPSSAARSPAPTASAVDVDGTYKSNTPDQVTGGSSNNGDEAGLP